MTATVTVSKASTFNVSVINSYIAGIFQHISTISKADDYGLGDSTAHSAQTSYPLPLAHSPRGYKHNISSLGDEVNRSICMGHGEDIQEGMMLLAASGRPRNAIKYCTKVGKMTPPATSGRHLSTFKIKAENAASDGFESNFSGAPFYLAQ